MATTCSLASARGRAVNLAEHSGPLLSPTHYPSSSSGHVVKLDGR
jgi:hypothetical protein